MTVSILRSRSVAHLAIVALFTSILVAGLALPVQAAAIVVNTTEDESTSGADCSLREAIENANTDTAGNANCVSGTAGVVDTISLDNNTYELTDGELLVSDADGLTITGDGVDETEIDGGRSTSIDCGNGNGTDRVLRVTGDLNLEELTVQNGGIEDDLGAGTDEMGGGIFNDGGDTSLDNVVVENNTVCDSEDDNALGGGIASDGGTVTILESTIRNNDAIIAGAGEARGGGIYHSGADLDVTASTINGNIATGSQGGGLWADAAGTLLNSTISSNDSDVGGGIFFETTNAVTLTLTHVTITNNDDAGITTLGTSAGVIEPEFTLVVDQDGGPDCDLDDVSDIDTQGYNMSSDASCEFDDSAGGDDESVDADLGSLADNDGPTRTHLPDENGDAVDAIDEADCTESEDQRGEDRPGPDNNDDCDVGSVEFQDSDDSSSGGGGGSSGSASDELDATPETVTNTLPGDVTHTVTAEFDEDELDTDDEDSIAFKVISGPNVKSPADESDFECSLNNDECTFTYTGNGQVGTDLICVWNDLDDDERYTVTGSSDDGGDCDSETLTPTSSTDDDLTDVVESKWATAPTPTPTPTGGGGGGGGGGDGEQRTVIVEGLVTISFDRGADVFHGRVLAARNKCLRKRTVKLKKGDNVVGKDKTDSNGKWRVPESNADGRYRAVATRKVFTASNGDRVVCSRAKSRRLRV